MVTVSRNWKAVLSTGWSLLDLSEFDENVLMPLKMYSCDFQLLAKFEKYYILLLIHVTPPFNTKTYFMPFETPKILHLYNIGCECF